MTLRSRLFAGVALPFLSVTMTMQPVLAAADGQSFEMAQTSDEQQPPVLPQDEQPQQKEEQPAPPPAEEPQAQAPEPEPKPAPAEEAAPAPAEQPQAQEPPPPAEQPAPEPKAAEPQPEPQAEPQPEPAAPAEQPQAEQPQPEQPKAEQPPAPVEQPAAPVEPPAPAPKPAQPEPAPADQAPAAEQPAPQSDAQPPAAEQPAAPQGEAQPQPPAQPQGEQPAAPSAPQGEQPAPAPADGQAPAAPGQPQGENGAAAPATTGQADAAAPAAPIVDKRSVEENQAIAADPAKTDDTVVLPVQNGAAVLDSDKDADNRGGQTAREERRQQREAQRAEEAPPPPKTDVEAQAAAPQVDVQQVRQQIEEKGQRLEQAPQFALPTAAGGGAAAGQGGGDTTTNNNTVNNTVVNNTVNNTTVNNSTVNNVVVVQQNDNRAVLRVDDRLVVRSDDRPRLRRDAEETYYDRLPRGRYRETIERPNGVRLVTVYNEYGDVIQRSRIGSDGEEYLLVYAPDADNERPPIVYDSGDDLPPMRLRIPVDDYIIDTSRNPDRDYYAFLSEPPVERVERTYSINEVKYSARLRDKVRRIDLDTITFATGSADVPMAQARTLRKVAEAIQKVLKRDQGETFLIEGHTDAVGSDQSNLILSDKRADSVASLLTEVYGIPPENLVTQGYGERYLKVRTQVAEQQNRRVTIRRVTPLVRPVARN